VAALAADLGVVRILNWTWARMDHYDWSAVRSRATPEGEAEYQQLVSQLRAKWPDLGAITEQPTLTEDWRLHTDTVGRLRQDAETHAHVTLVATMVAALPLMFTGAYLVHEEAPGRLLFVGRVSMPVWAQAWNALFVAVLGGLIALGWYQGRP
jgi:hypothetical protein